MNKLSCSAARDLLPLYVDGVLSPETAQEVRRHLETCEACRREHDRITGVLTLPLSESVRQESARPLRRLKKRVRNGLLAAAVLALVPVVGTCPPGATGSSSATPGTTPGSRPMRTRRASRMSPTTPSA